MALTTVNDVLRKLGLTVTQLASLKTLSTKAASGGAVINAGATKVLTTANAGATVNLDTAAGSVVTLPIATGSGIKFKFIVKTTITSNSHKIITGQATDYLQGNAILNKAGTQSVFYAAPASTFCSLQMPATGSIPSGGTLGDIIEFTDFAANTWQVNMTGTAGGTVGTPFNTATS